MPEREPASDRVKGHCVIKLARLARLFLAQRRKGAKKTLERGSALRAFAPLREKIFPSQTNFGELEQKVAVLEWKRGMVSCLQRPRDHADGSRRIPQTNFPPCYSIAFADSFTTVCFKSTGRSVSTAAAGSRPYQCVVDEALCRQRMVQDIGIDPSGTP